MMCNGSGIDAVAVTSYYHEWNKVRLNDSWYNVDCTWDERTEPFTMVILKEAIIIMIQ